MKLFGSGRRGSKRYRKIRLRIKKELGRCDWASRVAVDPHYAKRRERDRRLLTELSYRHLQLSEVMGMYILDRMGEQSFARRVLIPRPCNTSA